MTKQDSLPEEVKLKALEKEGNKARLARLKLVVSTLPDSPGVYQYRDYNSKIIYVGKAKNLKKRVLSYFSKQHEPGKTRVLVSKIADIRYIVVRSEADALLLENNLIKEHKPRYNVLLKDDKTYPSIVIENEYFPRVRKTRQIKKNGSNYFGPYSHMGTCFTLLELIRSQYKLRSCNLNLSPEKIAEGKYKVCLDYHIHKCLGPCVGKISLEDYNKQIVEIKEILKGNVKELSENLHTEMMTHAEKLEFEEAESVKRRYLALENYRSKSEIVPNTYKNIDVFSIAIEEGQAAYINYLHIKNGAINMAYTFEYQIRLNEAKEDILALGITEMRQRFGSTAKEIVVPFPVQLGIDEITFTIPQRGDKRKLLDLSDLNVKQYKVDRMNQRDKLDPSQRSARILKTLQDALQLEKMPVWIESFDNSNISGDSAVAACVVFKMGKPAKKEYRKYNIKTVEGPDDYASMREIVRRRYSRLKEEGDTLPNLIIADGGKGQMEAIRQVVVDELHLEIPIAGLAKDRRHRTSELLFGSPALHIGVHPQTPLFHLLEQIQDEVHRFAITFHRDKRSKKQVQSELDTIPGVGPKTKDMLLKTFKSVKRIKESSEQDIANVVGTSKGKIIYDFFHQTKE